MKTTQQQQLLDDALARADEMTDAESCRPKHSFDFEPLEFPTPDYVAACTKNKPFIEDEGEAIKDLIRRNNERVRNAATLPDADYQRSSGCMCCDCDDED